MKYFDENNLTFKVIGRTSMLSGYDDTTSQTVQMKYEPVLGFRVDTKPIEHCKRIF